MGKLIKDEFTDLKVSRQRKYQLRRARDGKCVLCGADAEFGELCFEHVVKSRKNGRAKSGAKKIYHSKLVRALQQSAANRGDVDVDQINAAQHADSAPPKNSDRPEVGRCDLQPLSEATPVVPLHGGRPPIKDEFTHLDVSRQRKYQLRCARDGKCIKCGAKAESNQFCSKHALKHQAIVKQRRMTKIAKALAEAARKTGVVDRIT